MTRLRSLLIVIVAAAAVLASSIVAADLVVPSDRVTTSVSVRAQASGGSPRIDTLAPGQSATLLANVPRWRHVRLTDGREGFVSKSWTDVVAAIAPLAARGTDELRIHFLNTGSGTCTVVECPGANAAPMIIDCGSSHVTGTDMTADQARDYVRALIGTQAPNVVLSHGDRDHYNLIPHVLGSAPLGHIWRGGGANTYDLASFPAWLAARVAAGTTVHDGFAPDWNNDGNPLGADLGCGLATTHVFTVNTGATKNAQSLVLGIEYNEFVAIFTGDAEGRTEHVALQNTHNAVKATVLTGSHHGASTHASNSGAWAAATDPEIVVYTAGDQYGHPRCNSVDNYDPTEDAPQHAFRCGTSNTTYSTAPTGRAEYVTHVNGVVVVTSDGTSEPSVHCSLTPGCDLE